MIYGIIIRLLDAFNALVLVYFVVLNAGYFITGLFAFRSLRRYVRRLRSLDIEDLLGSTGMPPITLIAPAFNEETTCVEATRSLLTLRYGDMEVLVCNDGSKDQTLERLKEAFDLEEAFRLQTGDIPTAAIRGVYRSRIHHVLWVIDKDNGGKADTLNAGLNFCRTPLSAPSWRMPAPLRRAASSGSSTAAPWRRGRSPTSGCPGSCCPAFRSWSICARSSRAEWAGTSWTRP